MSKCDIVKDLIPLYVENLLTKESKKLIEQHISECDECRQYYENINSDYKENSPTEKKVDKLVKGVQDYQNKIKLITVLVAMCMSSVIIGGHIEFLSTIPFLILTPFFCEIYYNRPLVILISSIPFSIVGGILSGDNISFIFIFMILTLIGTGIGVFSGLVLNRSLKNINFKKRVIGIVFSIILISVSCVVNFSLMGNPVSYIKTAITSIKYVNENYEVDELSFKGVGLNFKYNRYYGEFEYILDGQRDTIEIEFGKDGEIVDYYKALLEYKFINERARDLNTKIAANINYIPVRIYGNLEEELDVNRNMIDSVYYNLTYDKEEQSKARESRKAELSKIDYIIQVGEYKGEMDKLSKQDFLNLSINIYNALKEQNYPYNSIEINALDFEENMHSVRFYISNNEENLLNSYMIKSSNK